MFYVKLLAQVLGAMVLMSVIAPLGMSPGQAAIVGLVVFVWAIWMLAQLARHLTKK